MLLDKEPKIIDNDELPDLLLGIPKTLRGYGNEKGESLNQITVEVPYDTVLGFYIGKESKCKKVMQVVDGSVIVHILGIRLGNLGKTFDFGLSATDNSRLFIPEGWSYGIESLTPQGATIQVYSNNKMKRYAPPQIIDPYDVDLGIKWADYNRSLQEHEQVLSFQNFCNSVS